ncbi:basic form of pathogenesis-related protein 1-like [Arachis duranensis]|uniref:Basic form of pathogenesis-related protein 1-like n=1 Tax=Arachis duranensis TaxID=130453 RepID=A0A9C6TCQ1_ARADU|nr:basic form of pathogenesis-related protein 1-like [Arachis duranensis]
MTASLVVVAIIANGDYKLTLQSNAQNSPEDYLEAHNTARAKVGVKPLKWDWRLESYAYLHLSQKTEHCIPIQSDGPYGENTVSGVKATEAFRKLTGAQAVGVWVAQKQYYDEKSNSCIGGYCRHYMQVVWRDTTHIGCARVQCEVGAYMVSCNYNPPGNLLNQRPY